MPPIIPYTHELPSEGAENVSSGEPVYVLSDSDSLSGDEDHEGYEPLSQDPDNYIENSSDVEEDCNFLPNEDNIISEVNLINHSLLLTTKPEEPLSLNQQEESRKDLKLDEEKIETIKSVMKGIKLPQSNLPHWATVVPEEEWKSAILSDMLAKNRGGAKSTLGETSAQNDIDYGNDIPR